MPANPYQSQSIAGYNTSPPPDDGSKTAANKLQWSKHKTKLADPIKTLAEDIDTELVSAFGELVMTDDPGEENPVTAMEEFLSPQVASLAAQASYARQADSADDLVVESENAIVMMEEFA